MYPFFRFFPRLGSLLALAALVVSTGYSEDKSAPPPVAVPPAQAAPAQPAPGVETKPVVVAPSLPAAAPVAAPAAEPANPAPTPAAATTENAPPSATPPASSAPAPDVQGVEKPEQPEQAERAEMPEQPEIPEASDGGRDEVAPFSDAIVSKGTSRRQAVVIAGNLTVEGHVRQDAVAIAGTSLVRGTVDRDTVVVGGTSIITGSTGRDAVAVFSDLYLNGTVGRDVVVVFGNVHLGPNAKIHGQKVVVFGRQIHESEKAIEHLTGLDFSGQLPSLGGVDSWVRDCLLRGRLLAFNSSLGFAWALALAHLLFYFLIALIFPKGVQACVTTVEERPGMSLVAFILTLLALPFVLVLLVFTGIGIVVDVVLLISLFIAMRFGRAVMHAWLGRFVTRYLPLGPLTHVAFSVLVGGVLISLLYCAPFVGLMVHALIGFFGLGAVMLTLTQKMTRDRKQSVVPPPVVPPVPPAPPAPLSPMPAAPAAPAPTIALPVAAEPSVVNAPLAVEPPQMVQQPPQVTRVTPPPPTLPPVIPPPVSKADTSAAERLAALNLPRATFFQRVGALVIDVVLVAVVVHMILPHFLFPGSGPGRLLVAMAIYGAIFWKLKGTTVGGIILKLQVVRADGRPLDWTTSVVRGLGCLLSVIFVGLGFFWIAIDDKREAWHDKIAGTIVVRTPDHRPLV